MLRFVAPVLVTFLAVASAEAQYTKRWSDNLVLPDPQAAPSAPAADQPSGPAYTEQWSKPTQTPQRPAPAPQRERQPTASAGAPNLSSLPVVQGGKVAGRVEVRRGCDKLFGSRNGPSVPIRWFGSTQQVTVIGRRTDGQLCALYEDGTSEWITADRIMTASEKQAHDEKMQALGAGIVRRAGGADAAQQGALDMMDRLRSTGNALHNETMEQRRDIERHYEDKRRYGQ